MSSESSTESYPVFAHIGLRENLGKHLNQVTCPDRESNPGHLVSRSDALTQLKAKIREKRPGMAIAVPELHEIRFELLPHSLYSPDFAPSDFILFPKLKTHLAGMKFSSNEEVIAAAEGYFADLEESVYKEALAELQHRQKKCVNLVEGDYVEK
ncbi:hypothetical protein ANN_04986 [Periplaneta americana]|uniref:Uncharacterized protein n=1 Tax=Periplaneta americana TaxID=6978 RepID=A0ABQ8TAP6_PERAM|nr:hypothetical protein ANN_04986 [Periplaneta americana]